MIHLEHRGAGCRSARCCAVSVLLLTCTLVFAPASWAQRRFISRTTFLCLLDGDALADGDTDCRGLALVPNGTVLEEFNDERVPDGPLVRTCDGLVGQLRARNDVWGPVDLATFGKMGRVAFVRRNVLLKELQAPTGQACGLTTGEFYRVSEDNGDAVSIEIDERKKECWSGTVVRQNVRREFLNVLEFSGQRIKYIPASGNAVAPCLRFETFTGSTLEKRCGVKITATEVDDIAASAAISVKPLLGQLASFLGLEAHADVDGKLKREKEVLT
jgi:hypothetical protein